MPMEEKVWWGFGVAPVLLTSGYLQAEDQQKAERLGIRETIQKPATAEKLAGAVEKILTQQPARMHVAGN
jgi:CheY-like chemotaxis protein